MSLTIYSVVNASTPDNEMVRLMAKEDIDLKGFAIVDKTFDLKGDVSNQFRHIFTFPDIKIKKADFIRLYSGKGKYEAKKNKNNVTVHYFYWGSKECIWNDGGDVATLIKYSVENTFKVPAIEK